MTPYERIERAIRYIEAHGREQPRLETLAKVAGLSPHHFHRLFSRWAGATPKDVVKYLTNARAKELLLESRDVLGASLEAGLSGPGRLHDLLVTVEGVTPGQFKSGGAGVEIRYGFPDTPFGPALVAATPRGVCHVAFIGRDGRVAALERLRRDWPAARLRRAPSAVAPVAARLFGPRGRGRVPVILRGTPFQVKVWEALLRIPPGRAASYSQVAAAIGLPRATRAVGAAVGQNALAVLIPCHRVLQATGAFGGYRWGPARKRALLAWEGARADPDAN